ncbi:unnamed protein product, partial [Adineta ricciae]
FIILRVLKVPADLVNVVYIVSQVPWKHPNTSPYELTFGRQANLPAYPPATTYILPDPHDYLRQLTRDLQHYHRTAKQIILKQQQKTKSRYDRNRANPEYPLDPRFSISPKVIIDKNHPIYTVEDTNTKRISKVHVGDIRPLSISYN